MIKEALEEALRHTSVLTIRLALTHVKTPSGAQRIWHAERQGLNRPEVLRAASRRIEELGGSEPERTGPFIAARGEAVEAPPNRTPPNRIVEAVGKGRRHPGW